MLNTFTIPDPSRVVPRFAELPEAIQAAIEALSAPFPIDEVKVRPGPVRRDGTAAIAFPYGDWWTMYLPRLNDHIGPSNWTISLRPWGEHQIIARLSAFDELIVSESSGCAKGEVNGAQEAEVQAKKRVCAEGLLLGLYLYALPNVWGKGERVGKEFHFAEGEEQRCVYEMYRRAGLLPARTPGATLGRAANTTTAAPSPAAPERAARARAALAQAEQRVGLAPRPGMRADERSTPASPPLVSDAQLGLIARLLVELRTGATEATAEATAAAINEAGAAAGIAGLAALLSKDALRRSAPQLRRTQAARLIDQLKSLAGHAPA